MVMRKQFKINGKELTLITNTPNGLETVHGVCRGFDSGMVVLQEHDCLLYRRFPVGSHPGRYAVLPGNVQIIGKPSRPRIPSPGEVKSMRRVEGGPAEDLFEDFNMLVPKIEDGGYSELDRIPTPDPLAPFRHIDDTPLSRTPYEEYVFGNDGDIDEILSVIQGKVA